MEFTDSKMYSSENDGIEGNTFVVTGGLGFVGAALCLELLRRGARQVRAFDLRAHSSWSDGLKSHRVLIIQGDVACKTDVEKALRGADCVFHLASYGMSGKEMLQSLRIDKVNITGTTHILDACLQFKIGRLVYLSSSNVVFGCEEIVNGNESLQYLPLNLHFDSYSRSKSIAEQLVLKSNGCPFKKKREKCLYTCAIRSAAIYGPGEERHLPRIVSMAKLGLLLFKIGEERVKCDWVYIDNLVLALILASRGLNVRNDRTSPVAGGQPYFISDGFPVNTFEFLEPLLLSLDYELPTVWLSVPRALLLGKIFSAIYTLLNPWLDRWWLPQPFVLPAEVYKVGVTHYFSHRKAEEELGYVPMVTPKEGTATTIAYWQERKRRTLDGPSIYAWLFCLIGMSTLFCAAYLPDIGPVPLLRAISLFFYRSIWMVRFVFVMAIVLHVVEAAYAWYLARKIDASNARGWFLQTLALGFFSLRLLLKKANQQSRSTPPETHYS